MIVYSCFPSRPAGPSTEMCHLVAFASEAVDVTDRWPIGVQSAGLRGCRLQGAAGLLQPYHTAEGTKIKQIGVVVHRPTARLHVPQKS